MTFYVSTMPTFADLSEKALLLDNTTNLRNEHIDIVDMTTGEVYAIRHNSNLWEFCNYITIKDDRYYKLEKSYKRGLITYGRFSELVMKRGV